MVGVIVWEMLKLVVVKKLGVCVFNFSIDNGVVIVLDGQLFMYWELVFDVVQIELLYVELWNKSDWKFLGKMILCVDMVEKVIGIV